MTTGSDQRHRPRLPSHGLGVLALIIGGTALVIIDTTVVTIGLSAIGAELAPDPAGLQWVVIAYLISMGACTQVAGSLSDRIGRRRVYLSGVVIFVGASLVCGLAPSLIILDLARALQGIGAAILMSSALPLLSASFEGEQRNLAVSAWGSVATAAGLIAPLLGGVLIDTLGWRSIFLINIPIGLAVLGFGWRILPADKVDSQPRNRIDGAGTMLLMAGLSIGTFALLRGDSQGWGSPLTLAQVVTAVLLLVIFVVVETRVEVPILDLRMFRQRAFSGAAIGVFLSRVITIGGTVYFVQYAQQSLQLSPSQSGLLLMPAFLAQMASGMIGGKLLSHILPGRLIATGYALKAVAAGWLGLTMTATVDPFLLVPALLLWGLGGGLAGAPVMAVAINVTAPERAGMVSGTITSLASIGAGIGTAVLGAIYVAAAGGSAPAGRDQVAQSAATVLYVSAGIAIAAIIVVLTLVTRRTAPLPERET